MNADPHITFTVPDVHLDMAVEAACGILADFTDTMNTDRLMEELDVVGHVKMWDNPDRGYDEVSEAADLLAELLRARTEPRDVELSPSYPVGTAFAEKMTGLALESASASAEMGISAGFSLRKYSDFASYWGPEGLRIHSEGSAQWEARNEEVSS